MNRSSRMRHPRNVIHVGLLRNLQIKPTARNNIFINTRELLNGLNLH